MTATQLFIVDAAAEGSGYRFVASLDEVAHEYRLPGGDHADYTTFYAELARDFGTRLPHVSQGPVASDALEPDWRPLIRENLSPLTTAGYGDPAVLKTDEGYILVATSNDAVDAFPILRSPDLEAW